MLTCVSDNGEYDETAVYEVRIEEKILLINEMGTRDKLLRRVRSGDGW